MSTAIAVTGALTAAFCFALGSLVQQGVARESGIDILTSVQPLAATDVLFAVPLIARCNRRRLTWQDAVASFIVAAGIAAFLTVSPPVSGRVRRA